jgi:hypothetical protein
VQTAELCDGAIDERRDGRGVRDVGRDDKRAPAVCADRGRNTIEFGDGARG